jgi:hypothetical protein
MDGNLHSSGRLEDFVASGAGDLACENIRGSKKARHEEIRRPLVELDWRTNLLHDAIVHHGDPIADGIRFLLIMRDEDGRNSEALLEFAKLAANLDAQLRIEIRQGLVEEQHLGSNRDYPREGNTLLLAAGELRGAAIGKLVESDEGKCFGDALRNLRPWQPPLLESEGDIAPNRHVRPQGV